MYVVALIALWRIWRLGAGSFGSTGNIIPLLLVGFGVWHVVDTLLSHWILGIHRISVDSPQPLVWDLLWLVVFGRIPFVGGWVWRRRSMRRGWAGDGSKLVERGVTAFTYTCEFGDDWRHSIEIEGIFPVDPITDYPRFIDGERCAPPEVVGGLPGFEEFLEAMAKSPSFSQAHAPVVWSPLRPCRHQSR
jgi:hypothetical protein